MTDSEQLGQQARVTPLLQRILEKARQEQKEAKSVIERHYQAPSPETLRAMEALHEQNREKAMQAIQQQNNLEKSINHLRAEIGQVEQQRIEAETSGDASLAQELETRRISYKETLALAEVQLQQAADTAAVIQKVLAREEERLNRERERFQNLIAEETNLSSESE